jgi:hypothetical protein
VSGEGKNDVLEVSVTSVEPSQGVMLSTNSFGYIPVRSVTTPMALIHRCS